MQSPIYHSTNLPIYQSLQLRQQIIIRTERSLGSLTGGYQQVFSVQVGDISGGKNSRDIRAVGRVHSDPPGRVRLDQAGDEPGVGDQTPLDKDPIDRQLFYLARPEGSEGGGGGRGAGPRGAALHRYDLERRRDTTIQPTVTSYELTPDGRKMLYSTGGDNWFVGSTTGGGGGGAAPGGPAMAGGRGGPGRRRR